jgi:hypothetical protein
MKSTLKTSINASLVARVWCVSSFWLSEI